MRRSITLSLLALLAQQASANMPAFLVSRQSSADGLGLSSIPDACQTTCGPIESTISTCQDLSCLCNNDAAKQIADCANCLVAVGGDSASSLQTQEQSVIDQYTNACITSGEPISSIQVSSVAPSAAASGSGSGSATSTATSSGTSSAASTTDSPAASNSSSDARSTAHETVGLCAAVIAALTALAFSA